MSSSISDILRLAQQHLAADPDCGILAALTRARNDTDQPTAGAHFYLMKAAGFKPIESWSRGKDDTRLLFLFDEAAELAREAGE
jgi:hypothetical protein